MSRRILLFAEGISLSHVARPLALEKELARSGYETFFACDERYRHLFSDLRGTLVPIHSIPGEEVFANIRAGRPLFPYEVLKRYINDDLKCLRTIAPSMVIGDMRWSLGVSARLARVPYAAITNSYWSGYSEHGEVEIPYHWLVSKLPRRVSTRIFRAIFPKVERSFCAPLNRLLAEKGLPVVGSSLSDLNCFADQLLFADLPSVHRVSRLLPNHSYLGPCLWSYPCPLPQWWSELPPDKSEGRRQDIPIVYVNLGTSGARHLLKRIVEVVKSMAVVVVVGGQEESVSGNVFAAKWLPSRECCERASVCINNGGSTATYLAAAFGVPVLGIAGYYEQALSMEAFDRLGAGILMNESEVTIQNLELALRSLLEKPSYAEAAKAMARDIAERKGCRAISDVVRTLLGEPERREAA